MSCATPGQGKTSESLYGHTTGRARERGGGGAPGSGRRSSRRGTRCTSPGRAGRAGCTALRRARPTGPPRGPAPRSGGRGSGTGAARSPCGWRRPAGSRRLRASPAASDHCVRHPGSRVAAGAGALPSLSARPVRTRSPGCSVGGRRGGSGRRRPPQAASTARPSHRFACLAAASPTRVSRFGSAEPARWRPALPRPHRARPNGPLRQGPRGGGPASASAPHRWRWRRCSG
jgi:hypothetical protein